ncbi:MAG: hypothetical protein IPL32_11805 [Chloracidobacterium sp.]|nr:hypothetical protein [Chloracidobacterium sp.]
MERKWIEFEGSSDRHTTGQLYASLNQKGQILVNSHTYDQMETPEAVTLLYEPETETIGLRPASPLMPNAFPFRKNGVSGHRLIFARRFAKKHDIRVDHTISFYMAEIEKGILVLSLRHTVRAPRGHSRKSKKS